MCPCLSIYTAQQFAALWGRSKCAIAAVGPGEQQAPQQPRKMPAHQRLHAYGERKAKAIRLRGSKNPGARAHSFEGVRHIERPRCRHEKQRTSLLTKPGSNPQGDRGADRKCQEGKPIASAQVTDKLGETHEIGLALPVRRHLRARHRPQLNSGVDRRRTDDSRLRGCSGGTVQIDDRPTAGLAEALDE